MNPWALKNFSKSTFNWRSLSPFQTDYSYNVAAGLVWIHDFKMYSRLFYAQTTPFFSTLKWTTGLLFQSDLNISWNGFSFVFQISVEICLSRLSGTEVDKQDKTKGYLSKILVLSLTNPTMMKRGNFPEPWFVLFLSLSFISSCSFYFLLPEFVICLQNLF